jgi:peptide/nickel transport system permease protein
MTAAVLDPRAHPTADQASQWRLMWWAFRRHKLAMTGLVIVALLYLVALFAEFFAPYDPDAAVARHVYHPPQAVHFFDTAEDGSWNFRPHVQGMRLSRDRFTLQTTYAPDPGQKIDVGFFVKGTPYRLWGVIEMERRFFGTVDPTQRAYLIGADRLGRDMLSRVVAGTRISMSIGLVGVGMSLVLGIILGGLSGYYGGWIDATVQRVVEFKLAMPTIPIWLGLSAALPMDWPPMARYFAITVILSLIGWTELARVVRGRFLSLRTEDFVTAARLDGCSEKRTIFRHMLPSMVSHIIASVSLAIPGMILAETSLSFLGLGLLPPTISWGVLLKEAQNVRSIAQAPWLFAPGAAVCLAVLALNFLGDGLRDASDPYAQEGR